MENRPEDQKRCADQTYIILAKDNNAYNISCNKLKKTKWQRESKKTLIIHGSRFIINTIDNKNLVLSDRFNKIIKYKRISSGNHDISGLFGLWETVYGLEGNIKVKLQKKILFEFKSNGEILLVNNSSYKKMDLKWKYEYGFIFIYVKSKPESAILLPDLKNEYLPLQLDNTHMRLKKLDMRSQ